MFNWRSKRSWVHWPQQIRIWVYLAMILQFTMLFRILWQKNSEFIAQVYGANIYGARFNTIDNLIYLPTNKGICRRGWYGSSFQW
ncbi:MAG: hypothetical protein R3D02_05980 [Hyphomicrobiales bacterium]